MHLKSPQKIRYEKLDLIRGITLISMILYHTCWDLVNLYDAKWPWYYGTPGQIWQQSICWTFILLSGFCWSFGRKKLRRGLLILSASALVSVVSIVILPDEGIIFGILSFIGSAMILLIPLEPLLSKKPWVTLLISAGMFFLTWNINFRSFGILKQYRVKLPKVLYANYGTACLGFPFKGFYSSDYFPILPWIFLYICGFALYLIFVQYHKLECFTFPSGSQSNKVTKPLQWLGKHTLILYLLHQPVVYVILSLLFR